MLGVRRSFLTCALSALACLVTVASAGATTVSFSSTGAEQTFVVPPAVTTLHVVAIGGAGAPGGHPGGLGASVTADIPVTAGQTLFVEVGSNGSGAGSGASGFNGGAPGGDGNGTAMSAGGAGGGATDLRSVARAQAATLTSRLLVAGGGGGGGAFGGSVGGGGAADANGQNGFATGITGGGAGSLGAGAAGAGAFGGGSGAAGAAGAGGAGGGGGASGGGGGGGGGGYFGGGGGGGGGGNPSTTLGSAIGAGGGGGASWVMPGAPATIATSATSTPSLSITYQQPAVSGPSALSFGPQSISTVSAPQSVVVSNGGSAALHLSSITLAGADPGDFVIDSSNCLGAIPAAGSCSLLVRFAPTAAGARAATLAATSDAASGTLSVALTGTGSAAPIGATGLTGDPGPTGLTGPRGQSGAAGPPGAVPVATCRKGAHHKVSCTVSLATIRTPARTKATLVRGARTFATGTVGSGGRLTLTAKGSVPAGTYVLRLTRGRLEYGVTVRVKTG